MQDWVGRLQRLDASVARGEFNLSDLDLIPPPRSMDAIRAAIAEDPPLEGKHIAARWMPTVVLTSLLISTGLSWLYMPLGTSRGTADALYLKLLAIPLAVCLGIFPTGLVMALYSSLAARFINTVFRPINVEAASSREYQREQRVHAQLIQAKADALFANSLEPWKHADGPTFEWLTARHFRKQGWEVQQVGGSNDGGVDLRLRNGSLLVLVQCKAHARPVAPTAVRDLYGATLHDKAGGAILVCLSGASKAAKEWAEGKPIWIVTPEQLLRGNSKLPPVR